MLNKLKKMLVEYGLIEPKYCSFCGKELLREEFTHTYDPITGNLDTVEIHFVCPDFGRDGARAMHYTNSKVVRIK